MRAVLYTHDMIPITVMTVPREWQDFLMKNGSLQLAVMPRFDYTAGPEDPVQYMNASIQTVRITVETLVRRGEVHYMLFTEDEEAALLLKSEFLPGQMWELQEREFKAFTKGFFSSLLR